MLVKAADELQKRDLEALHQRQEAKLADLHAFRDQEAEQARYGRQLDLDLDTARLDALAEQEAQEDYVPGRNEEQRKRQRDTWLAAHPGYQRACRAVQQAEVVADGLELERHRVEDELGSIKALIQIRIAELNLIAAFVGRQ